MRECAERAYFKRRALQELAQTLRADGIEAELAHNRLTGLHLEACVGCCPDETKECENCELKTVCDREIKPGPPIDRR